MDNTNEICAIIVDDEEEARDVLERLLQRIGGIEIIGKAENADEAFDMIITKHPDIVMLDVQMPGQDGFDLVQQLKRHGLKTTVIFVTAHLEYAINALKVAAYDYLLKPVVFTELKETINRFKCERINSASHKKVDLLMNMLNKPEKVCFNTRTGYIYIAPAEVVFCSADINYTEIHFGNGRKEVVTLNIGKVEEIFSNSSFHRMSRSHLINIEFLIKADRKQKSCTLIKNGEEFNIPAPPNQIRILENLIHAGKF